MNRRSYLTGDCALLAVGIWRIAGWWPVEMFGPYHVLIRMPDGRYLDASGVHAADCLDQFRWREVTEDRLAAGPDVPPDVMEDAAELLERVSRDPVIVPLAFRPGPRHVSAVADLASCGLVPASRVRESR